jgi:hypothetical protein
MAFTLAVVHDFHIPRRALAPLEAYPPLVIDADAVLAAPVAVQSFEPIAWRNSQMIKRLGRIDPEKLSSRPTLNVVVQLLYPVRRDRRSSQSELVEWAAYQSINRGESIRGSPN